MYKRLSAIMFPIAALLFIGAVYWGYQENQDKNAILIKAENQYQRAFHDLSYHVNQLKGELGNTLAVSSKSQAYHRKGLVNVWRITSQAQTEINELPLTLLPFSETEQFLTKISNFSYMAAVRDLTKKPLSEQEYATLKTLYKKSQEISKDLAEVQTKVIGDNLRWMDVELALATNESAHDKTIIDGLKTVDKKVSEYEELDWGPSIASMYEKRTIKMLSGKQMTADQIGEKAAKFLNIKNPSSIKVVENGAGTEYSSFSVLAKTEKGEIEMDYTKIGGQPIWFMLNRAVAAKKLTLNQAKAKAQQFLQQHQYPTMLAINYDVYGSEVNFTFAEKQKDVILYPHKLTVKVALDNGDITSMQASDYVYDHRDRKIPAPKIDLQQAKSALNPDFAIKRHMLALIKNDLSEEVLCYEFVGSLEDADYRIYLNAESGVEEKIERI